MTERDGVSVSDPEGSQEPGCTDASSTITQKAGSLHSVWQGLRQVARSGCPQTLVKGENFVFTATRGGQDRDQDSIPGLLATFTCVTSNHLLNISEADCDNTMHFSHFL